MAEKRCKNTGQWEGVCTCGSNRCGHSRCLKTGKRKQICRCGSFGCGGSICPLTGRDVKNCLCDRAGCGGNICENTGKKIQRGHCPCGSTRCGRVFRSELEKAQKYEPKECEGWPDLGSTDKKVGSDWPSPAQWVRAAQAFALGREWNLSYFSSHYEASYFPEKAYTVTYLQIVERYNLHEKWFSLIRKCKGISLNPSTIVPLTRGRSRAKIGA
jgi:hypothetical protein